MSSAGDGGKGGLWRHRDFRKLWAGETVALFGSEVTELALPLVAVLALDAGAGQMGLLAAAPRALRLAAASFPVSAATLLPTRQPEPAPPGPADGAPRAGLRREIGE